MRCEHIFVSRYVLFFCLVSSTVQCDMHSAGEESSREGKRRANSAEERLTRLGMSRQRRIPARLCTESRLLDELHALVQVVMLRTRLWHEGPSWRRSVLRVIRVGRVVLEVHSQDGVFNFLGDRWRIDQAWTAEATYSWRLERGCV